MNLKFIKNLNNLFTSSSNSSKSNEKGQGQTLFYLHKLPLFPFLTSSNSVQGISALEIAI